MRPIVLTARFASPRALGEACRHSPPPGTLFVRTTTPLEPGAEVMVDLGGRALPRRVLLRGLVFARQRAVPRMGTRAGLTIGIDPADAERFVASVAPTDQLVSRRHQSVRIPVSIPVRLRPAGAAAPLPALLVEVSIDGALLRSEGAAAAGEILTLELPSRGVAAGGQILARVSRRGAAFLELRFLSRDPAGFRRIRELLLRACELGDLERLL